jgi:hypothetical protein
MFRSHRTGVKSTGSWLCNCFVLTLVFVATSLTATAAVSPVRAAAPVPPPVGAIPDYQLGGSYPPPPEVGVITRDRTAQPVSGKYSICYVNGFQTQPGELPRWPEGLLLHRGRKRVFDRGWPDEVLLNTSTARKRTRIARVMRPWIRDCADRGFIAIEFDNLDSFTRSRGLLKFRHNLLLARKLVTISHRVGLAVGQKNTVEKSRALRNQAGFDFAVTESCAAYQECQAATRVYGTHVIDIEYAGQLPRSFEQMCRDPRSPASMVLRDRDLSAPGTASYVFRSCVTYR